MSEKSKKLKLVADQTDESIMSLQENKKVKKRTKIIFATGIALKAITTTSNSHFVRSANNQVSSKQIK